MLSSTNLLSILILCLIFVHYIVTKWSRRKESVEPRCSVPLGPRGHWLLGHSALPNSMIAPTISSWKDTHGPILEVFVIPKLAPIGIVISDVELIREMLNSRDFANRDDSYSPMRRVFNPDLRGLLLGMWTHEWKELRKFVLAALTQLGFGKAAMEDQIVEEVDEMVDAMLKTRGQTFHPERYFRLAVSNVISRLLFGTRAEIGKASAIHDSLKVVLEGLAYLILNPLYNTWPGLVDFYRTPAMASIVDANADVKTFIDAAIEEHEKSLGAEEQEPRDFIDAVIIERRKRPNEKSLSAANIQQTIVDLFGGGTDTTNGFLNWNLAWLLHYPDIKAKLIEEIKQVIGLNGRPTVASMARCHYHLAYFDEVLRCSSVADFTLHHKPTKPVVHFAGHVITQDKLLVGNLWACNNDPKLWPEPEKFRPERHLDAEARYKKSENLIPFGIGVRRCIGEKLARLDFFIFTVRMLQRLDFRLAPGTAMPTMFGKKELVRMPEDFHIVVQPTAFA